MKRLVFITTLSLFFATTASSQTIRKVKITDVDSIIANSTTPLIVNFWATFCIPCIEEIPYFEKEVKAHAKDKVQLLLVSLDLPDEYPTGIMQFMKKRKFTSTSVWLDETNADYFCPKVDPKWSGAIPASLFINNAKKYRQFYGDQLTEKELKAAMKAMLE